MGFCVGCSTCEISPGCPRAQKATRMGRHAQRALGYVGTTLFMLGALAVAMSPQWSSQALPFVAFLAGHAIWLGIAYHMHEKPLMTMNGMYLAFDIWAVAVRL